MPSVDDVPAAAKKAYYRWRFFHEAEDEAADRLVLWTSGYLRGRRDMLEDSVRWADLVPLLRSLLEEVRSGHEGDAVHGEL